MADTDKRDDEPSLELPSFSLRRKPRVARAKDEPESVEPRARRQFSAPQVSLPALSGILAVAGRRPTS